MKGKDFKVHQATRDIGFTDGDDKNWPHKAVVYDPLNLQPDVVLNPSTSYGGNVPPPFEDPDYLSGSIGENAERPTKPVDLSAESRNNDRHPVPFSYGDDSFLGKPKV